MRHQLFTPEELLQDEKPLKHIDKHIQDYADHIHAVVLHNSHNIPNRNIEWKTGDGLDRTIQLGVICHDKDTGKRLSSSVYYLMVFAYRVVSPINKGFRFNPTPIPSFCIEIGRYEQLPSKADEVLELLDEAYRRVMDIREGDLKSQ